LKESIVGPLLYGLSRVAQLIEHRPRAIRVGLNPTPGTISPIGNFSPTILSCWTVVGGLPFNSGCHWFDSSCASERFGRTAHSSVVERRKASHLRHLVQHLIAA